MSRRRSANRALLISIVTLLLAIAQRQGYFETIKEQPAVKGTTQVIVENQPGLYKVTKFTDGDTIVVDMNGSEEKIRLIGVDTPETHDPRKSVQCYGQAAANFTKQLIGQNNVRLEADPTNTNRDRYNRLLRYVFLPDGQLVNAEIIKQGYGFAYIYFPFTKMEEFKGYETEAKNKNLGLWGNCGLDIKDSGQTSTQADGLN